jgi:hypothetical protein
MANVDVVVGWILGWCRLLLERWWSRGREKVNMTWSRGRESAAHH